MESIFISYRRDDAEGQAGRLFNDLAVAFGKNAVFMDVAALEPGRDFRRAIDERVASCGALLAVIGKNWLTVTNESGARRLDDPMDFVRLETASALKRDIPVIPVLVQGAKLPRADELPTDIRELVFRNAVELTHARWDSDVRVLMEALRSQTLSATSVAPAERGDRSSFRKSSILKIAGAAFACLFVAGLAAYAVRFWSDGRGSQTDSQTPAADSRSATPGPAAKQSEGVSPTTARENTPRTKARRYGSLVGAWTTPHPDCDLRFEKDDGQDIQGTCINAHNRISHTYGGRYRDDNWVEISVTRIDIERGCIASVSGHLTIQDHSHFTLTHGGWRNADLTASSTKPIDKCKIDANGADDIPFSRN